MKRKAIELDFSDDEDGSPPIKKVKKGPITEESDIEESDDIDIDEMEFDDEEVEEDIDDDAYTDDGNNYFTCDLLLLDHKVFKIFADIPKYYTDHINVDISSKGISYSTLDSSNVALITGTVPRSEFKRYTLNKEGLLGMKSETLSKSTTINKGKSSLNIVVDEPDKCKFIMGKESGSKKVRNVALMNVDNETYDMPEENYVNANVKLNILASNFNNACKEMSDLKIDTMNIHVNEEGVVFKCEDNEGGSFEQYIPHPRIVQEKIKNEYTNQMGGLTSIKEKEKRKKKIRKMLTETYEYDKNVTMEMALDDDDKEVVVALSLAYISKITQAIGKSSKYVQILIIKDGPVMFKYFIENKKNCSVSFFLAPRISEEDNV